MAQEGGGIAKRAATARFPFLGIIPTYAVFHPPLLVLIRLPTLACCATLPLPSVLGAYAFALSYPDLLFHSEGRTVPTKSLFEQEAPKIGTQKCSSKRGVSRILHVEFPQNNRELVKAEVSRKECSSKRPHSN